MKQDIQQFLSIKWISFEHYDAPPHFSIPKCNTKLMIELRNEFPNVQQQVHPRALFQSPYNPFEYMLFYQNNLLNKKQWTK